MKKIKKGYIILGLFVFSIYYYFHYQTQKNIEFLTKKITQIITDIRREDYFKLHQQLMYPNKISIENIKNFSSKFSLNRDLKVKLKNFENIDNIIKLNALIKNNDLSLPIKITLQENNNNFKIVYLNIGNNTLEDNNFSFPIILSDKNNTKK